MVSVMGQDWNIATMGPEDADRTLLLCNGIGASVETVEPFASHFKRTRLIAFDVPGVGRSPTPWSPYRFTNLTRMLDKILDELDVGVVDVFGVSWGGALAQQFAFDFKKRCRSLTLAATSAGVAMVPGNISVMKKMVSPKRYQDPEYMMEIGAEIYGGAVAANRDMLRSHTAAMQAGDKKGYLYQLLAGVGWTSIIWLRQIKVPTLILMGDHDPIVPPVNGKIMASRLPNATVELVDCGHMFILTQAERVADRVEVFIHNDQVAAG